MMREVRGSCDEWVVYKNEIRCNIEDGKYLVFTLVAHTWDFLPDADGEKHYSCNINEFEGDTVANEYWRGFIISEEISRCHYERHSSYFNNFITGMEALDKKHGFEIDEQTQCDYADFIDKFCSDISIRDKYNLSHNFIFSKSLGVDERLHDVLMILKELGIKTFCSCQGTDMEWTDYPSPIDGHSVVAYISVTDLPDELKTAISEDYRLRCRDNCISTTDRKYNSIFPSILFDAIENAYPGNKVILQDFYE